MCVCGASEVLELEVVVRTECGCRELHLGPLQEEWVSLTSEPSLHCRTHSHPSEKKGSPPTIPHHASYHLLALLCPRHH